MTLQVPRGQWPRLLRAAARESLLAEARIMRETLAMRYLALPQNGLALLPLRDGAYHESFNLGEIPLAQVRVALQRGHGEEARGAAWVMEDDMETVTALAMADAVMAANWPEAAPFIDLLAQGEIVIERLDREHRAMLAATTVDFSLLGSAEDDDEDADKEQDHA